MTNFSKNSLAFKSSLLFGAAAILIAATGVSSVQADPLPYKPATKAVAATATGSANGGVQVMQSAPAKVRVLNLPKGRSAVIDLPVDASDVFVSNPAIADAVLRTPRRIFVLGVDAGQSDAIFFDQMGRQILNLSIRVDAPTDQLADMVARLFPHSHVEVQSLNGKVVLSGMAQNNAEADQVYRLAQGFVSKPEDVVNLISIAGKDQVTLKVRIVEVNRSTIKQLGLASQITYNNGTRSYSFGRENSFGVNGKYQGSSGACYGQKGARTTDINNSSSTSNSVTNGTSDSSTITNTATTVGGVASGLPGTSTLDTVSTTTGTSNSTSITNALSSAAATAYSLVNGTDTDMCLQAFERVGLARTLAEPNLTAISGEAAKFLAGGEFPVPVAQDNQGRVTVDFKPFGVGLGFTPVVLSSGRISLKVSTEVSELSNIGALALTSTLSIPALTVRRAETTIEMQSGSSMMIAGLLQSKYKQAIDSMPGLTSLPILGSLFRSRDFLNDETELVVMVTPYIVSPVNPSDLQSPADNLQIANDATSVFMGRLNKVIKAKKGNTASQEPAAPYQAPIGYVIE